MSLQSKNLLILPIILHLEAGNPFSSGYGDMERKKAVCINRLTPTIKSLRKVILFLLNFLRFDQNFPIFTRSVQTVRKSVNQINQIETA